MAEKLPYIISGDAEHLVKTWGHRKGLAVPDHGFFTDYQSGLVEHIAASSDSFEPEVLPHEMLAHGLQGLLYNHTRGDAVALDRAYVGDDFARHFEVTRAVDRHFNSIGTHPRPHTPSIPEQLDYIVANSSNELTLVDDVIFSGDAIVEVAEMFKERGARVAAVLAAVAIGEGRKKIEDAGIEVVSVVDYEDVADEICERDFVAGIPFSGRTVYREDGRHYSAPYFQPFGRPETWASIESSDAARKLSQYCLDQSAELWAGIEKLNGVTLSHREVPRPLMLDSSDENFAELLRKARTKIS